MRRLQAHPTWQCHEPRCPAVLAAQQYRADDHSSYRQKHDAWHRRSTCAACRHTPPGSAMRLAVLTEAKEDGADAHLVHGKEDLGDDEAGEDAHSHGQDRAA
eukprot:933732-Pelagomonas_calceolata.AAC.2